MKMNLKAAHARPVGCNESSSKKELYIRVHIRKTHIEINCCTSTSQKRKNKLNLESVERVINISTGASEAKPKRIQGIIEAENQSLEKNQQEQQTPN